MANQALHHRAETLAASFPPILIAAERVAAAVSAGMHGRRRAGPGETFWQFRRHQTGDAVGAIDWRRSARSDHHFVRETEWAAAQPVYLWRDGSASMAYRSDASLPTKEDRAGLLLLALASLLVQGGERVALMGSGTAPVTGRSAVLRLVSELDGCRTGLSQAMPLQQRARVVLIGDFLDPLNDIEAGLVRLARQGARGHMLQVLDPAEESLPFSGRVRFEGTEGEDGILARRAESLREGYRSALARHRDALGALARNKGWSFGIHRTDHGPETALMALYQALEF